MRPPHFEIHYISHHLKSKRWKTSRSIVKNQAVRGGYQVPKVRLPMRSITNMEKQVSKKRNRFGPKRSNATGKIINGNP